MRLTDDADTIRNIIKINGHLPEHNFNHYFNVGNVLGKPVFPVFGDCGIMGFRNKYKFWCYTDPIAPKEKRVQIFMKFLQWSFENGAKKFRAEISEDLWKTVLDSLDKCYRAIKPSFIFYWPVFDLREWDPMLPGVENKKLRNIKNSFTKNHRIETVSPDQVSKKDLINLIKKWKTRRVCRDRVLSKHYMAAIKNNFEGYDSVRIILIDDAVCILNGGWKIPNSNNFYSQLGIHSYSMNSLGEFSYIEDLETLKGFGYDLADFGGSTEKMLAFKIKFNPKYTYKTIEFSIVKIN